jgi:hypothetical protein
MNNDNQTPNQEPAPTSFRPSNQPLPETAVPATPLPNPYTVILSNTAKLKKHSLGKAPVNVIATLYSNHIEVLSDNNDTLLDAPLTQLEKIKKGSKYIKFVAFGEKCRLDFGVSAMKMQTSSGPSGQAIAKAWKSAFEAQNVKVGTAFI